MLFGSGKSAVAGSGECGRRAQAASLVLVCGNRESLGCWMIGVEDGHFGA